MSVNEDLLKTYKEVFDTHKEFEETVVQKHLDKLKELDLYLPPSNTFFIITNTSKGTFEYISKNTVLALGIDPTTMYEKGIPYWLSHFHPTEIETWVKTLADLMEYTMFKIEPDKREKLNYQWNFRIKTPSGHYLNLVENQVPLYFDELGKPIIGIGHLNVIGEDEELPIKASIKILNEKNEYETIYNKNYSQLALPENISNREKDVIRLLVMHNTSKEISEKLSISRHTVDTHRRNILQKLNINNTQELISMYVKNGYF